MKKILGLDLGTNSIGWALVEKDNEQPLGKIIAAGSRILPMSQDVLGKFDAGQSISQTAERTHFRSIRRLRERQLLRRERLHRILNLLQFLPEHYSRQIDFENRFGKFIPETEPKIAYRFNEENKQNEFLFKSSFQQMLQDFQQHQPELVANGKKVPYDWTIYFLRKKALTKKIEKEELAWLLLHFNQKRGYYQLRGEEEEENTTKKVEFYALHVVRVEATSDKKGDDTWYNVHLENGWTYRRTSRVPLDWDGKLKEFIVTTELNEDGTIKTDKEGKEKRSFRAPDENDWTLLKKKTEWDIEKSGKTVGAYIYDTLLQRPSQKIRGKLVRVVERRFYKAELEAILYTQKNFHPELNDFSLYNACIEELYPFNDAHRSGLALKDFTHLFVNDIIFYQRPLKSKTSLISNCKFENRSFTKDGQKMTEPVKCIAKSHPLFQEFRLWQFVQNLRIYQKEKEVIGKLQVDVNITQELLQTEKDYAALFDWLNDRKEIEQKTLFKQYFKIKKPEGYRWNYVEDKAYPCNETRALILSKLSKLNGVPANFLTKETEEALWHILYSVTDKIDIHKALNKFAVKNHLENDFVDAFKKFPAFDKAYGSLSAKAIKKLLPLMRMGKYWHVEAIDSNTRQRIEALTNGEWDENIRERVRQKAKHLETLEHFRGLEIWLASYVVYNRHSEDEKATAWKTPTDIQLLPQHSLRNPIVEQVINETLQVVKDIWQQYGKGVEGFFDEVHVELGREMKNPAEQRAKLTKQISENENTNLRIKALLIELKNDPGIENVRPHSPMQQELLKIYEEGVLLAAEEVPEYITKISKQAQPTQSELARYKLWLQQKYRSPYTGNIIPLSKLFTPAYEIEHIIPQSRYFDDSLSNKVICEAEVNKDKDNATAYEYIKTNSGKKIALSFGQEATLFTLEQYEHFVKTAYVGHRGKLKKLLMEDIPDAFSQRQLNDSRYISKAVKNLLSNLVREEGEEETVSKNVLSSNGAITATLRKDWGLEHIWNEVVTPRFERLNKISGTKNFGDWSDKDGKRVFQTAVPLELQKGFQKKRIDHRHHALDAIVIACATRNHINYLNNENANGKDKSKSSRHDLRRLLRRLENVEVERWENGQRVRKQLTVAKEFYKPWEQFTEQVRTIMETMVVSFKQNLRILNKSSNTYQHWKKVDDGTLKKETKEQTNGAKWAIRKPLHKDTVSGLVKLRFKKEVSLSTALDNWQMLSDKELKVFVKDLTEKGYNKKALLKLFKESDNRWNGKDIARVEVFYWEVDENGEGKNVASRVKVDESFGSEKIRSVTDTGIQQILFNHLAQYNELKNGKTVEHPELAFSPDGIDAMNKNLAALNNGRYHQPIYKVRTFEPKGNKFVVGQTGNKKAKYVEAAKGTNLFFAIYTSAEGKRSYETIALNIVVERLKQGMNPVPEKNEAEQNLLFSLSPNDLVYVPAEDERENTHAINWSRLTSEQTKRIYKMVSSTGNQCMFIRHDIATSIVNKFEFSPLNKMERAIDGSMIKEVCIKLKANRLGMVLPANGPSLFDEPGAGFDKLTEPTQPDKPVIND